MGRLIAIKGGLMSTEGGHGDRFEPIAERVVRLMAHPPQGHCIMRRDKGGHLMIVPFKQVALFTNATVIESGPASGLCPCAMCTDRREPVKVQAKRSRPDRDWRPDV